MGLIGTLTSSAALLGIIIVLFIKNPSDKLKEGCTFLAAGIMLAASTDMLFESWFLNNKLTIFGFISGWLFVKIT